MSAHAFWLDTLPRHDRESFEDTVIVLAIVGLHEGELEISRERLLAQVRPHLRQAQVAMADGGELRVGQVLIGYGRLVWGDT